MEAIRLRQAVQKDGEIFLSGLPFRKGEAIELVLWKDLPISRNRPRMTARQLLNSDLIGMWENRDDIGDSATYARQLREQAQNR